MSTILLFGYIPFPANAARRRALLPCAGLLAFSLLLGCDLRRPKPVDLPPPLVQVSVPVERTVTDYALFTARTAAAQSVDIKARVTGYLTAIHFQDGALVNEGEVLFEIDDRPYKAARDQANAAVEVAKAALVEAQAEYDIGLAVQRQSPGAISKQEITRRLGARDEAAANVDEAQAALANAELNYSWCKVVSPISGRINRHFVDVGNLVNQDVTLLSNIVSEKPVWAYFDVDENSAREYQKQVEAGQVPSLRTTNVPVRMALTGDTDFPFSGQTDFVSNQFDPNTGSIRLRATFSNEKGALAAGMFGRIRIATSAPHAALLVLDSAIGTNQGQRFILVVNNQNEVEYRPVDVGQLHNGLREVMRFREITETGSDGRSVHQRVEVLRPDDHVVVNGLQRVRPGVKVNPQLVDMTTLMSPASAETKNMATPTNKPGR